MSSTCKVSVTLLSFAFSLVDKPSVPEMLTLSFPPVQSHHIDPMIVVTKDQCPHVLRFGVMSERALPTMFRLAITQRPRKHHDASVLQDNEEANSRCELLP